MIGIGVMPAVWRREMALGVCQPTHGQHGLTSMTSVEKILLPLNFYFELDQRRTREVSLEQNALASYIIW